MLPIAVSTTASPSTASTSEKPRFSGGYNPRRPGFGRGRYTTSTTAAAEAQEEAVVSQSRPAISTPFVAPANELEQRLASIWKDSLGLAEIGVDDNFFQLGGHSLGLVQIIMKCRKALRADIPVGDPQFLANPTIKAMARFAIAGSDSVPVPEMPGIKRISRETYRVT